MGEIGEERSAGGCGKARRSSICASATNSPSRRDCSSDILNLFDNTGTHQIDYFYSSQLANETAPVYDVHFKPVDPLSVRLTLSMTF